MQQAARIALPSLLWGGGELKAFFKFLTPIWKISGYLSNKCLAFKRSGNSDFSLKRSFFTVSQGLLKLLNVGNPFLGSFSSMLLWQLILLNWQKNNGHTAACSILLPSCCLVSLLCFPFLSRRWHIKAFQSVLQIFRNHVVHHWNTVTAGIECKCCLELNTNQ